MTQKSPSNEVSRSTNAVTDQRLESDGNRHAASHDAGHKRSQNWPGQELRHPQKVDDDGE